MFAIRRTNREHPPSRGRQNAPMADPVALAGCTVELPPEATGELRVYVNGDEQREPEDYAREGAILVFARPLVPSRADGFWRRLTMFTAGVGFYGQGDAVDVHYVGPGGEPGVASNLRIHPPVA
jgi:hypothetical protein